VIDITPDIKRKDSESNERYLLRIGDNKDTLGLSWQGVADLMNESLSEDYGESKWRKDYALLKRGFDLAIIENISEDEILKEYENKKIEVKKEVKKVQSLNVELNRTLRETARKELLWDQLKESITQLPVPEFNSYTPPSSPTQKVGVLSFGDIHFYKVFKSLKNEYSVDIAKQRMQELLYETVDIVKQQGFDHIHVINGADSIEGMSLRISQLQSIQSGFIDQTIAFCKFISAWLNELSKHVRITYWHINSANHSEIRPFSSSRGEFPSEDLEKVIMHYVHDVLENNPRIEVPITDKDFVKIDVLGYNVWALHGHQLKGKKNAIRDLSILHREFIDYLYIAHYHHSSLLTVGEGLTNDVETIQIPSVMGSDEYSDSLMTGAKAGALFDIYEKNKGRTIQYKIKLN
jgi:hypothetical protein